MKSADSLSLNDILYGTNTLSQDSAATEFKPVTETFLQPESVNIHQEIILTGHPEWIIYLLLVLLAGLTLTWYYLPEKIVALFILSEKKELFSVKDDSVQGPGLLIRFFFFMNYFIVLGIFIFIFIKQLLPAIFLRTDQLQLFVYIGAAIIILFIYRNIIGLATGFIFRTTAVAKSQLGLYTNMDSALGIIMIPILLVILFTQNNALIYISLIIVVITHIFRWFQTFFIGKSVQGYTALHLFIYLCTLEIIPLMVLIRLLQNGII